MDAGVHLPQCRLTAEPLGADRLRAVAGAAGAHGFAAVSANDHLAFRRPWLDGPSLLAAVAGLVGDLQLATTIALPSLRGPAALAAALATLDVLAPGRLIAGLGPGSSAVDHALAGVPFEERWQRFDAAVEVVRALLRGEATDQDEGAMPVGRMAEGAVPVWVASWGSAAGLRRVARHGDGWLASAYHTAPEDLAVGRRRLEDELSSRGRGPLPCAVATMWTHVTDDAAAARRMVTEVLASALATDAEDLGPRVCVGTVAQCVDLLGRYAEAGCSRVYLWPVTDEVGQLARVAEEVLPQLPGPG